MEKTLPKNWVEPKLDEVVLSKKGKKPKILNEVKFEGSVPYLDIKAFEKNEIRRFADAETSNLIKENEIAIVWDGARSGWVGKGKNGAVGSTLAIIKPLCIESEFLYRFLQSKYNYLTTNTRGIGIPHVDPTILWNINFPLPPLAEQQRIVAKLDELFGHLDSLKTRLNNIPQILKNFRQAVLTQAVTGKLTEEWRVGKALDAVVDCEKLNINARIVDKKGWVVSNIKDYLLNLDSSRIPLSQTVRRGRQGEYPYYGATGIIDSINGFTHDGEFILISEDGKNLIYRTKPIAFLATGKIWVNNHAHVLQVKPGFSNLFAIYFFNSIDLTEFITGIDQLKLSQKNLNIIPINIPSILEQTEIVKRVEHLFAKADAIEAQYQSLKTKIDNLPQAILAKAFKGELVEQLDTDGDAKELLEVIEKLKESLRGKKQSVKKKKK